MTAGASKLKGIDFSSNGITTGGSTFIADFLATNPILEQLVLESNRLDDEDAESIAGALKHNTNLRYLVMQAMAYQHQGGMHCARLNLIQRA